MPLVSGQVLQIFYSLLTYDKVRIPMASRMGYSKTHNEDAGLDIGACPIAPGK